jgi:hypothetical protein
MSQTQLKPAVEVSREQLRDFHIAARGLEDLLPSGPLCPADLDKLDVPSITADYPVYFDLRQQPRPLASWLRDSVGAERLDGVVAAFAATLDGKTFAAIDEIRSTAFAKARGLLNDEEFARVTAAVPATGWLLPFSADAVIVVHAAALIAARQQAKQRFLAEIRHYRDQLRELLIGGPQGRSPESIAAALAENEHFDAEALAQALRFHMPGHRLMQPERRSRILEILSVLDHAVRDAETEPALWLFDPRPNVADLQGIGVQTRPTAESFERALEFCEEQLDTFSKVMRALRAARLEAAGAFDRDLHQPALDRLNWQAAAAEELTAITPVLIIETADLLADASLTAFGRVLRSGLPVQVLVLDDGVDVQELDEFVPDFGYLAIAHREAFVLQSSAAAGDHLLTGIAEVVMRLRPAVAVVSVPRSSAEVASGWRETAMLHIARCYPLYTYDPDAGESWLERFRLRDIPAGDPLTAAHAAAFSPEFSRHFRVLPANAATNEQVNISGYLEQYRTTPPLAIPFLQVQTPEGPRRAVMTRDLANLCRDRRRAWRILEELAGIRNAHVEAAIARTREEMQALDGEREKKLKQDAAAEAIYRVVSMLTNG